jgi:hypothetical protein
MRSAGILLRCLDVEVDIEKWHHLIHHPADLQAAGLDDGRFVQGRGSWSAALQA